MLEVVEACRLPVFGVYLAFFDTSATITSTSTSTSFSTMIPSVATIKDLVAVIGTGFFIDRVLVEVFSTASPPRPGPWL